MAKCNDEKETSFIETAIASKIKVEMILEERI